MIGGSGLYALPFHSKQEKTVETPFTKVELITGELNGKRIGFLPRHGKEHEKPPSQVEYRGNIYSLFQLGAEWIIATSAVGSLDKEIKVGSFVLLDQIMDFTKSRVSTFFNGDFQVKMPDGRVKKGVVHTDMTNPYCQNLRDKILEAAGDISGEIHPRGTYVCTEGPRFETASEIRFFSEYGEVIGMTQVPEVFLANELEICYATISTVTNYAAGIAEEVSHEEVIEVMDNKKQELKKLITRTVKII